MPGNTLHAAAPGYEELVTVDIPVTANTALALPVLTTACRGLLTGERRAELQKRFDNLKVRHDALRKQWQTMAENEQDKSPISVPWLVKQTWEMVKDEDWALVSRGMGGWPRRLWDWERPGQYVGGSWVSFTRPMGMSTMPARRFNSSEERKSR